jgi:hypothetical protein
MFFEMASRDFPLLSGMIVLSGETSTRAQRACPRDYLALAALAGSLRIMRSLVGR